MAEVLGHVIYAAEGGDISDPQSLRVGVRPRALKEDEYFVDYLGHDSSIFRIQQGVAVATNLVLRRDPFQKWSWRVEKKETNEALEAEPTRAAAAE